MKIVPTQIPAKPYVIADSNLISSNVTETDYPAYAASTTYVVLDRVMHVSPTSAVTISNGSPCLVSWTAHMLTDNTAIRFTTTGALPAGITAGVIYYVRVATPDSFRLCPAPGKGALSTSSAGSGTHTAVATRHDVYEAKQATVAATAAIASTVMTVTAITAPGVLSAGMLVTGVNVAAGTRIVNQLTGTTGSTGTYAVSISQTAASAAVKVNAPLTDKSYWARADSTNRWRMYDSSASSQTSRSDSIAVVMQTVGRVDTLMLCNINAAFVITTQTDAIDGLVYNKTISGVSVENVNDIYDYYFAPIIRKSGIVIDDLLPYGGSTITVTLTDIGGTALCGTCLFGLSVDCGGTRYGLGLGIQDYSKKIGDEYGNYLLDERASSKRVTATMELENTKVDYVFGVLAEHLSIPAGYIGTESFTTSQVFGFYKDSRVEVAYPTHSIVSIDLEDLA